jgi:hypothetical protein
MPYTECLCLYSFDKGTGLEKKKIKMFIQVASLSWNTDLSLQIFPVMIFKKIYFIATGITEQEMDIFGEEGHDW